MLCDGLYLVCVTLLHMHKNAVQLTQHCIFFRFNNISEFLMKNV